MVDQNYIDLISERIASQTQVLQAEIVRDMRKLSKSRRFQSIDDFLIAMEQLDMEQLVLIKSRNIMLNYESAHIQILKDMDLFADITEETLRALTNFSTSSFSDHLGSMGGIFKKEIVKGVLGGATEKGILQAIQQQAGLSNPQMRTLINTSLNDYTRSVGKIMIDNSKVNRRFRYVGAIDDKTRPICLKLWERGAMTKKEIESLGGNYLIEGGGFNCRHVWVAIDVEDKSKDFRTANA